MRFLFWVMVLPMWAFVDQNALPTIPTLIYLILVNGIMAVALFWDKKQAVGGRWRVPEWQLHALEWLGAWPASLIMQNLLRHKTKKLRYQIHFWLIIGIYQIACLFLLFAG